MDAVIEIVIRAIDHASNVFHGIGGALGAIAGVLGTVRDLAGAAIGAVAGVLTGAAAAIMDVTQFAAEFEYTMSAVNAVLDLTPAQMQAIAEEATRLGRETIFTAKEAGESLLMLARMGLDFDDVMSGVGDSVMKLAAALGENTEAGLRGAAEITAAAMKVFKMSAGEVDQVVDAITGAVMRSGMTMNDFRIALVQSGATASMMGIELDDLSTALAVMSQNGVRGERAGTGLRNMLTYLVPRTKEAAAGMEELGLIQDGTNMFFDQATGKVKPLVDIISLLEGATKDMTEAERQEALQLMFGVRARGAVNALLLSGSDAYREMQAVMANTSAEDIAAERLDNVKGAWEMLSGEIETAKITLGRGFLPVAKDFILWLEGTVASAQPVIALIGENLPGIIDGLKEKLFSLLGMDAGGMASAFQPLTDLFDKLASRGKFAIETDFATPTGMENLPVFLRQQDYRANVPVDGSVGVGWDDVKKALSGVLDNLFGEGTSSGIWDALEGVKDSFTELGEWFKGEGYQQTKDAILELIDNLPLLADTVTGLTEKAAGFLEWLSNLATKFSEAKAGWDALGQVFEDLGSISEKFDGLGDGITDTVRAAFTPSTYIEPITDWVNGLVDFVKGLFGISSPSTVFSSIGADLVAGLFEGIGGAWGGLIADYGTKLAGILEDTKTKWEEIKTATSTKWEETKVVVGEKTKEIYDDVTAKMKDIYEGVRDKWEEVKQTTTTKLNEALVFIKGTFNTAVIEVKAKMGDIAADIGQRWDEAKKATSDKLTDVVADVKEKFRSAYEDHVKPRMDDIKTWVQDRWADSSTATDTETSRISTWARERFVSARDEVQGRMGELASTVLTKAGEAADSFSTKTAAVVLTAETEWPKVKTAVETPIGEAATTVDTKIGGMGKTLTDWANSAYATAKKWGEDILKGIRDGWNSLYEDIKALIDGGVTGLIEAIKRILGPFGSPSKKTLWMGRMMALGIAEGFIATMREQNAAISLAARGAMDAASVGYGGVQAGISSRGAMGAAGVMRAGGSQTISLRPTLVLQMGLSEIARMSRESESVAAWRADAWSPAG